MIDWTTILREYGDRPLFVSADETIDYKAFAELVQSVADRPGEDNTAIPIRLEWKASSFARLLGTFKNGHSVVLTDEQTPVDIVNFPNNRPLVILRSGGTSGEPKHVVHSFETLIRPYTVVNRDPHRILILYAANHIAGLDAFFQAIHRGSTLVIPEGNDADSVGRAIEDKGVDVLPATPTNLQFLLLGGIHEKHDLSGIKAIPHGAEPMAASLRSRVETAFPNAELLHRFGLTEMGPLPVRPDPVDPDALFLDAAGYAWKLVDGEIHIRGLTPFLGTLESGPIQQEDYWHPTGDLGKLTESGAMRILGRRESIINVGGEKVFPEVVENFLLDQEGVLDAMVSAGDSPLTGQTVLADVVLEDGFEPQDLLRCLRKAAIVSGLPLAFVPTRLSKVTNIEKSAFGKRIRRPRKA